MRADLFYISPFFVVAKTNPQRASVLAINFHASVARHWVD